MPKPQKIASSISEDPGYSMTGPLTLPGVQRSPRSSLGGRNQASWGEGLPGVFLEAILRGDLEGPGGWKGGSPSRRTDT